MMQSGYTVKRYSEVPKTIILTRDRIFQLRFCRSLIYISPTCDTNDGHLLGNFGIPHRTLSSELLRIRAHDEDIADVAKKDWFEMTTET